MAMNLTVPRLFAALLLGAVACSTTPDDAQDANQTLSDIVGDAEDTDAEDTDVEVDPCLLVDFWEDIEKGINTGEPASCVGFNGTQCDYPVYCAKGAGPGGIVFCRCVGSEWTILQDNCGDPIDGGARYTPLPPTN